jgi:hypothetical protein
LGGLVIITYRSHKDLYIDLAPYSGNLFFLLPCIKAFFECASLDMGSTNGGNPQLVHTPFSFHRRRQAVHSGTASNNSLGHKGTSRHGDLETEMICLGLRLSDPVPSGVDV